MVGIFSKTIDSNLVEAISYSGLDFMIFDQEHGTVDLTTIQNHVRATKMGGMTSVIRVAENNHNKIGSAFDTGADMVQVPNISSVEQAKQAIEAAKFYPKGNRGVCCYVKAANFGTTEKSTYLTNANTKQLILQVEGKDGMNSIDSILELDGFDILFIGPYDLSQSLGYPGQVDHPEVVKAIEVLAKKVKATGKILGTFVDSFDKIKLFKEKGFRYIAFSVDLNLFAGLCKSIKKEF
ncbi:HpcH/HpaI aldolase family protein [Psychroflexus planctonicus]|uniref:2,4-dihydroxyhept-2-ene-1,7-dioic acid aldolase n=1 Tax=Psychroflexus planctonicus TaxID=1526575 RepID=A0ABQ1SEF4_9FLAO|nr:aldolase/citrate lyase family protein [Psychroflexus planctonicus]GGE32453.1 2,4-dihydroxyhept-2-ene-1,7-dioic acid aldolase [Psychroflexus planctonicus]